MSGDLPDEACLPARRFRDACAVDAHALSNVERSKARMFALSGRRRIAIDQRED